MAEKMTEAERKASARRRAREYQKTNLANGKCAICPRKLYKWGRCRRHYNGAKTEYAKRRQKVVSS